MSKYRLKTVHIFLVFCFYALCNHPLAIAIHTQALDAIKPVNSFDFFEAEAPTLDKNSLVIFDVDKVLLIRDDPWERGFSKERSVAKTISSLYVNNSDLSQTLDRPTRDRLWSIYARSMNLVLVDNNVLKWIDFLKAKSIKSIALTRCLVGRLGHIQSFEDLRVQDLLKNKIDFSYSFPNKNNFVFEQFSYEDKHPVFKDGILITTLAVSKGPLLKTFFDRIKWRPTKIVMIDDKRDNLESVQAEAQKMNILFIGYLYTGADKLPVYFDKKIAEWQMQYLIDHEHWISAEEASKMLKEEASVK